MADVSRNDLNACRPASYTHHGPVMNLTPFCQLLPGNFPHCWINFRLIWADFPSCLCVLWLGEHVCLHAVGRRPNWEACLPSSRETWWHMLAGERPPPPSQIFIVTPSFPASDRQFSTAGTQRPSWILLTLWTIGDAFFCQLQRSTANCRKPVWSQFFTSAIKGDFSPHLSGHQ